MSIVELRQLVGRQIGIPNYDGSVSGYAALSPAQQIELTQACLEYIRNRPDEFTPGQVETANVEASRILRATPEDTGFDGKLFFQSLGDNVISLGANVATIGTGISTTLGLAGSLIPVVFLAALAFFAYTQFKSLPK